MKNMFLILGILFFLAGCKMTIVEEPTKTIPTLTTVQITSVTDTSALSGGSVVNDGDDAITLRGICWANKPNPTISDNKMIDSLGMKEFVCKMTGLAGNTVYYVRAFATNSIGTSYGNELSFTTPAGLYKPVLSSTIATNITHNSVNLGASVQSDGGTRIISKGVCWSTKENPSLSDNVVEDKSSNASIVGVISGLESETTYYVRAYATNLKGVSYGEQMSFTTPPQPNTVKDKDGNIYHTITIGTQTWMMENLRVTSYRNGDPIPYVKDDRSWLKLSTGAQCTYDNSTDANFIAINGRFYNWYAAVDPRGIAPVGWHVPTKADWETFNDFVRLNKLTSTDVACFSARTYGYRYGYGTADYVYYNKSIFWWSVTQDDNSFAWSNDGDKGSANFGLQSTYKKVGVSIRCVKDN
jgi:uncharacterized protein (TIGR02145 family)